MPSDNNYPPNYFISMQKKQAGENRLRAKKQAEQRHDLKTVIDDNKSLKDRNSALIIHINQLTNRINQLVKINKNLSNKNDELEQEKQNLINLIGSSANTSDKTSTYKI